jgi:light-regulated signal transduction histidine kinase (bacteriophytochrome)
VVMGVKRDGGMRWISVNAEPVFDPGEAEPRGAVVTFADVTARKRAEDEIKRLNEELRERVAVRTEQLDAATREVEALAYSVAHDVRSPLRAIDGFSAAVLEDEAGLSDEGVASLERVRAAAQTLARLLDDLSGLSRASRRELVRQTIDLTALAHEIGDELAGENPSRRVRLTVAPGLTADADPVLARLVIKELLGNAWKFTAPNAEANVTVGALDLADARAFSVSDDGVGFDMRYAEHLFGAFQRMHPPGEFEGDGVGLALVQRLIRRHGGRCWAEAAVGEGATFFFTLPERGAGAPPAGGA